MIKKRLKLLDDYGVDGFIIYGTFGTYPFASNMNNALVS